MTRLTLLLTGVLLLSPQMKAQPGNPSGGGTVGLHLLATGFVAPVTLTEAPDGSGRLFVVDQVGLIWILHPNGELAPEPFLDLRDRIVELNHHYDERGLLGLAFHPEYKVNGRLFVYYSAPLRESAPDGYDHTSHISEFVRSPLNPNQVDPTSERIILRVDQPQSNHNAGTLAFGPGDGCLYISIGDGGNRDDEGLGHVEDWYEQNAGGNGQDLAENLLGNILRIDVDGGDPYSIPAGNPFIGREGLDEIYAYGFRNPYRFSFDLHPPHHLYVGDAGQELWEEVSLVTSGGNYGWNVKEGTHCFDAEDPENPPADCPEVDVHGNPLIDPVIEFANAKQPGGLALVVVGGYVYRGTDVPQLSGRYIFGGWSASHDTPSGRIFVAKPGQHSRPWKFGELRTGQTTLNDYLLGFGQDIEGEVYVLTSRTEGPTGNTGNVYKISRPGKP